MYLLNKHVDYILAKIGENILIIETNIVIKAIVKNAENQNAASDFYIKSGEGFLLVSRKDVEEKKITDDTTFKIDNLIYEVKSIQDKKDGFYTLKIVVARNR